MENKISASIMCGDFLNLSRVVKDIEESSIELIHVDVMDGNFVPNLAFGPDFCKALRKVTDVPLDIHLMVNRPEDYIDLFQPKPGEYISIHAETTNHPQRLLSQIKKYGAKPAVALNPATSLQVLEYLLPDTDMVLIMTVNPGFAGQKLFPQIIDKIERCRDFLDRKGYPEVEIEVDGNVSFENAERMKAAGANIFVSGSSGVFSSSISFSQAVSEYRQCITK